MAPGVLEKVTVFILRRGKQGSELLLFQHPYAGIQIPAGTVEEGETHEQAARREAQEETGLSAFSDITYLGMREHLFTGQQRATLKETRLYARPDSGSFDWGYLRRGIWVTIERQAREFSQVTYKEFDHELDPHYVTMQLTGWVPDEILAEKQHRHFFTCLFTGKTPVIWPIMTDNHRFELFWAPLKELPSIIPPQDSWLDMLHQESS